RGGRRRRRAGRRRGRYGRRLDVAIRAAAALRQRLYPVHVRERPPGPGGGQLQLDACLEHAASAASAAAVGDDAAATASPPLANDGPPSAARFHSGLIPAAFATFAHLSISARMNAANCSGVLPTGSAPSAASRSRTSPERSAFAISVYNRCTTS